MKKLLFIYNPMSGKALIKRYLSDIIDVLVKAGYAVSVRSTQSRGEAAGYIMTQAEEFDRIICAGGDGTLNEVITGLFKSNWYRKRMVPLGYIPAGSTNDFANSINLPKNMVSAAHVAVSGRPRCLDLGTFNDRNFVYVAAFGAFIDVSYSTPQELKNIFGHQAYIVEGIKKFAPAITSSHHIKFVADGRCFEGDFMYGMVSNSNFIGGFKGISGKRVALNDGLFEVTLVKKPQTPIDFQEIISSLLLGKKSRFVCRFKTAKITFVSDEKIEWVVDGEYAGAFKKTNIKNHHKAINAITGENVFV